MECFGALRRNKKTVAIGAPGIINNTDLQLMNDEQTTTRTTRKGFLKRAGFLFAGAFAFTGFFGSGEKRGGHGISEADKNARPSLKAMRLVRPERRAVVRKAAR